MDFRLRGFWNLGLRTSDFRLEKVASPNPGSPKSDVRSPLPLEVRSLTSEVLTIDNRQRR